MSKPTSWKDTGDYRIAPWLFGIMRAEKMQQRSMSADPESCFQVRWVSAGALPPEYDGPSAFGFWSTMATPENSFKVFGARTIWKRFITYFQVKDINK